MEYLEKTWAFIKVGIDFLYAYPIVGYIITALIVFFFARILSKIAHKIFTRYIEKSSSLLNVDPTGFNFFKNGIRIIIYISAALVLFFIIPPLNQFAQTLTVGATVIAAVAAFASQHALANVVGGIFIVIFKPFRVGDLIQVGAINMGTVEDITLRHTVIRSFQNRRIIIPNASINNETIVNSSIGDAKTCMFIEVGISYNSDHDKASELMQQVCEKHESVLDNRTEEEKEKGVPLVVVRLIELGDSSQLLRAYVWAADPETAFIMKFDLLKSIKKIFDANDIEIPFPHRTLYLRTEPDKKPHFSHTSSEEVKEEKAND